MRRQRESYDPQRYWDAQHVDGSLRAVGQTGLPDDLNAWLYRIGRRNVVRFLARSGISRPLDAPVLDVGAGTGFWAQLWLDLGAREVDGVDLSPRAVDRLRARFPRGRFSVADVSATSFAAPRSDYPLVTVMNVLLHVPDETGFSTAVRNITSLVPPGGHVLVADAALVRPPVRTAAPGATSIARPVEDFVRTFAAGGLDLVAIAPSTVIGANPIDARSRAGLFAWSLPWQVVRAVSSLGPRAAGAAGRVLAAVDPLLLRTSAAPSGKLMLFRRAGSAAPRS